MGSKLPSYLIFVIQLGQKSLHQSSLAESRLVAEWNLLCDTTLNHADHFIHLGRQSLGKALCELSALIN